MSLFRLANIFSCAFGCRIWEIFISVLTLLDLNDVGLSADLFVEDLVVVECAALTISGVTLERLEMVARDGEKTEEEDFFFFSRGLGGVTSDSSDSGVGERSGEVRFWSAAKDVFTETKECRNRLTIERIAWIDRARGPSGDISAFRENRNVLNRSVGRSTRRRRSDDRRNGIISNTWSRGARGVGLRGARGS